MALQTLHTDRYGDLLVVRSFHEGPRVIHLLENGCYVNDGGLPIKEKKELQKGLPLEFLPAALDWFEHKDDRDNGTIREIKVLANNTLVFADDGSPVTQVQDIINFYEPGAFREAALIAFANKLAADKAAKQAMPLGAKKTTTDKRRESMEKLNAAKKAKAPRPAPKVEETAAAPE